MTREEAAAAAAALVAERDTIQANLLELDASFGRRMLSGAANLDGATRTRWAGAQAALAGVWQIFEAYSAAVDRVAGLAANLNRQTGAKVIEIDQILRGRPVQLTPTVAPIGQRELTAGATPNLSLVAAVAQMKQGYDTASDVCAAAEAVWGALAERVQRAGVALSEARKAGGGSAAAGDEALDARLASAQASLDHLRHCLSSDPLSLWQQGQVDGSELEALERDVETAVARAAELGRLRSGAQERITAWSAGLDAARSAWTDALVAEQRAAARVAGLVPRRPPDFETLSRQGAALRDFAAQGRWGRLATDLDAAEKAVEHARRAGRDAEAAAQAQLAHRDELRGLLGAYEAKAVSLGAAEDIGLGKLHQAATDLLWTAPCDLAAAERAVTDYQQAVLALGRAGGTGGAGATGAASATGATGSTGAKRPAP